MTPPPTTHDHLPVYESLVRELGDVLTETREVAEQAQHEARQALAGHQEERRGPAPRQA
ncbi:hypothetical protein N4P33_25685 [Streptomyces sp. 15-116A]|uniref:hypothetical protein n=1 Tax=Streptomyces sp. 15-116A TaxID=2259035 RepID=UPI0021B28676|nr:hypothetical protein [Streptomyces sp. 15-116A]MCT7355522.1 hypothetical protein [Streptomyces sp. 15-116A]